jgi:hypothetical protein
VSVRFHPVCEAFPQMDEEALGELTADIRAHGLRESIWRHRDGSIVDGRNRYLACTRAGIAPKFRTFEGPDSNLPAFVVSLNIQRRHLSSSQRAMVAEKLANLSSGRPSDRNRRESPTPPSAPVTRAQAAELLNVGADLVADARTVRTHGVPELVNAVEKGEVAVSSAAVVAKLPEEHQRKAVAEKNVPDVARHAKAKGPVRSAIHAKKQHPKPNREMQRAVSAIEGICLGLQSIDVKQLDADKVEAWSLSLSNAASFLRRLSKGMTNVHDAA